MLKKIIIILLIIFILLFVFTGITNTFFCKNSAHLDTYPVNPICTKCKGRDGIVQHKCTIPNGKEKYCSSCGKIVIK